MDLAHDAGVDPVEALERLGGIARARDLLQLCSRRVLARAVAEERVRRAGRGRYVLPAADQARRAATLYGAYLVHLSAAMHWGWEVRFRPDRPQLAVRRGREVPSSQAADIQRVDLDSADVDGWATTPLLTVLMCARDLPFADALAVADSALRHGDVTKDELLRAARNERERRVAHYADRRAANPFESSLRAIVIECGVGVIPQYQVEARGLVLHPDLVDPIAGVVFEAESWEFHGKDRGAFEADCERYTALVVTGWRVLRFTWAEVMLDPAYVRACLRELYAELAA